MEEAARRAAAIGPEFLPDAPLDIATLYATKGGLDLSTLSELTNSAPGKGEDGQASRSKRTCVRVREEISKLQEILQDEEGKPAAGSRGRGRGGAGRGKGGGGGGGGGRVSDHEAVAVKKYRRPAYRSQFTHKRRKKRRKQPEEGRISHHYTLCTIRVTLVKTPF